MVRADLPRGVQAANLIHAAGHTGFAPLPAGVYAVALTVPDELELRALANRLARAGLPRHLVVESDEPYAGQAMALGIRPLNRKLLARYLARYPLLR